MLPFKGLVLKAVILHLLVTNTISTIFIPIGTIHATLENRTIETGISVSKCALISKNESVFRYFQKEQICATQQGWRIHLENVNPDTDSNEMMYISAQKLRKGAIESIFLVQTAKLKASMFIRDHRQNLHFYKRCSRSYPGSRDVISGQLRVLREDLRRKWSSELLLAQESHRDPP